MLTAGGSGDGASYRSQRAFSLTFRVAALVVLRILIQGWIRRKGSALKLRVRDNSIRLRLTRSEVDRVNAEGRLAARLSFPDGRALDYALTAGKAKRVNARFDDAGLDVEVPAEALRDWAESDQISIAAELPLPGQDILTVLVEKDYACLTPRDGEDESDMFAHPES